MLSDFEPTNEPQYHHNDIVEIEAGQGVLLFGGELDPQVMISCEADEKTQEDCALALWALHDPDVRALFRKRIGAV